MNWRVGRMRGLAPGGAVTASPRLGLVALAVLLLAAAPAAESGATTVPSARDDSGLPVFSGSVDVNLIDLYVTVVDARGRPVRGLTEDDFRVFEDGEEREITNFEALVEETAGSEPVTAVAGEGSMGDDEGGTGPPVVGAKGARNRFVAILFDTPSLQARSRRRLLAALEDFVREGAGHRDQFLIAANVGELEILKGFSSYEASVLASLRRAAELPTTGEAHKLSKRYLKRSIYRTEMFRMRRTQPGNNGVNFDPDWTRAQGNTLLYQINAMRHYEADRIRRAISVVGELARSMAGINGRKTLVWVGEDLALRPAVDLYTAFYRNAAFANELLHLYRPEIWAEEVNLKPEFQALVATAQACGVTMHIIDTSDRDREAGTADYSPPTGDTVIAAEATGGGAWTPGTDFSELRTLSEGAQYAALATGGVSYNPGRNLSRAMDTLQTNVATSYYLGYRRPGPPDGERHRVEVKVAGTGTQVRHHERILDRTPPQRLVDLALSRLRLDMGGNPLQMELELGDAVPAEKNRVIRSLRIKLPLDQLVLLPHDEGFAGQILVAVVVIDDEGLIAPPQLLRMHLELTPEQLQERAVATQTIRLLMKPGSRRLAVSVRDEVSGIEGSQAVVMPGSGL